MRLNLEFDNSSIFSLFGKNFRQISEPNSIHENIKKIRPGHGLLVKNGKIQKVFQWWKPRNSSYNVNDFTSENLRLLLENAVSKRIKTVGSFLSGIDILNFIASREKNKNLKTYALGLDKDDED